GMPVGWPGGRPAHNSTSPAPAPVAASIACCGTPFACASPGMPQLVGREPPAVGRFPPVTWGTGPGDTAPFGASGEPRRPVRVSCAEDGDGGPAGATFEPRPVTPGTGAHELVPAEVEYRENLVQPAAKFGPVPVHRAQTAKARPSTVSRLVTRMPCIATFAQDRPPSWVAYNCGPNAQPLTPSRNRSWLTPVAPSGAPA